MFSKITELARMPTFWSLPTPLMNGDPSKFSEGKITSTPRPLWTEDQRQQLEAALTRLAAMEAHPVGWDERDAKI